ncbi:MAG: DNA-directed RNA polymerase subunit beta [candidate division WOR-3 bacterium]
MNKKNFTKFNHSLEIPPLLSIQLESYRQFFQFDKLPEKREDIGLQKVFKELFPIVDTHHKRFILDFVKYEIKEPRYSPEEALQKGLSYDAPFYVTFRFVRGESVKGKEEFKIKDVIEQDIYLFNLPLMTNEGTFIVNGNERVVVNQLHRAPGVYLIREKGEHSLLLVPLRGAWFEMIISRDNDFSVLLDRKKRLPLFLFLQALGYSPEEVLERIYPDRIMEKEIEIGDMIAEKTEFEAVPLGEIVTEGILEFLQKQGKTRLKCVKRGAPGIKIIHNILKAHSFVDEKEALEKIFRKLRGTEPQQIQVAKSLIEGSLFDVARFDLGKCGRFRLNQTFNENIPLEKTNFEKEELFKLIRRLLEFYEREIPPDDIDHLAARRVRSVGELIEPYFRNALFNLASQVKEKILQIGVNKINSLREIIQGKPVEGQILKFFTQHPLCQYMEQVNPLSSLIHKRRVSALGPGGLTKETAGFEVRDVHYSHYGRICPIETPEGANIGLINTIATYTKINEFGFLTTPYWRVKNGIVTKEIVYLAPYEEENYKIAQFTTPLNEERQIINKEVVVRYRGDIITVPREEVDFMDVSPKQLFSPSTVMIPFLEHNDADRALMGANMQRQAVPLLKPEKPLVATGVEEQWARESGAVIIAEEDGEVIKVDSERILIKTAKGLKEYRLKKFKKTNQYTCYNQIPKVKKGMKVKKGDLLADGPCTDEGQLALGKNILVAFLPWRGYNYEDAIVISENLLKEDTFTSIQILEFDIQARETKLGPEEITRDIPGATEEDLAHLDKFGIVRIGTEVAPGDILVGRITPRGETEFMPEEKLLRAIFGEKAANVRDTSLRVEPGVYGTVIDVQIFTRRTDDPLAKEVFKRREEELEKRFNEKREFIVQERNEKLKSILLNVVVTKNIKDKKSKKIILKEGEKITEEFFISNKIDKIRLEDLIDVVKSEEKREEIKKIFEEFEKAIEVIEDEKEKEYNKLKVGDELPSGVLKWIRVYIAQKRKISVGDKLAGRHGNKGVIAKILPVEDMPYLPDGTPVDMVLNPLGVPSRMNIGQILETALGWAMKASGCQAITPIFEGATIKEIKEELKKAGLPEDGKITLYDGRTGLPFKEKAVVGYIYMMKLIHMVDDKIHARSVGRYSLITQQPLGGKAQFGGQRFGEMEVWALEAYGAAYTLQEMLTIKSDDVEGRIELFESLIKGTNPPTPKIPASFSVLVKELRGLCLDLVPINFEKEKR